jgi:patatin-related protein
VTSSHRDTLAELIAQGEFLVEDLQELRLALVMTGGVSLAIWMGGATVEFDHVLRGENPTYLELLRLTRSLPRIDVITGTSAGGLNGALLAYAVSQDAGVAGLRALWLELGALEKLLRQPTEANPTSLMLGDDYFLPQIKRAFSQLEGPGTSPEEVPMELIITTTLLTPWPRGVPDAFGTIIHDVDHRGELSFRRGVSQSEDDPSPDDDFAVPDIHARLALAARCTASFPLAFEASYVPIGARGAGPTRPDMADVANFQQGRFVIDGGVLLNRPLRPALRAIFRQPASRQVRRVLAYVVPDPGEAMKIEADDPADDPSLADVAAASMVRLPRNQSVSVELDELTLHNARVAAQRRRRELVVVDLDVDDLACKAYDQYRGFRADLIGAWLLGVLARGFTALELHERSLAPEQRKVHIEAPLRERTQLRERLIAHLESLPPEQFPRSGEDPTRWFTTVDTVERAASVVLDLLRRGLAVMDPGAKELAHQRHELRSLRSVVCTELSAAQATRRPLARDDELTLAQEAVLALRQDEAQAGDGPKRHLGTWVSETLPEVLGNPEKLGPIVARIAAALAPAATAVVEACKAAPEHLQPRAAETRRYAEALVCGVGGDPGTSTTALHRLLALEVVQLALGGEPIVEQRVDLIQVSGDAGNGLDPREQAEEKLAGLQAGHFGAFYKRSWRANDWMWGRHDAAQRLAQLLLEPARLRQLGHSVMDVVDRVEAIAFNDLGETDRQALRDATPRRWDPEKAEAELSFLEHVSQTPPATIPMCAQAVARRLQLDILREELPEVRRAIALDEHDGAHISAEARQFCEQFDKAPQPLTAADAIRLLSACQVGQEKIASESGSNLLARTATRTVAVATSAFSGQGSGLPKLAQRPLKTLRGLGLLLYLVVRYALEGSRLGAMLASAGLFAGATLVGVGLVIRIPGILMVVGLGAILAALFLALWKRKWAVALAAPAFGLLVALLPGIFGIGDKAVERWQPVFVVAGLLVAAFILGRASFHWPEHGSTPSDPAAGST